MLCMNWKLALITFCRVALHRLFHQDFSATGCAISYRRIRVAIARINLLPAGAHQWDGGPATLQPRAQGLRPLLRKSIAITMDAFKDAIMAYSVYYPPVVEILSAIAILPASSGSGAGM